MAWYLFKQRDNFNFTSLHLPYRSAGGRHAGDVAVYHNHYNHATDSYIYLAGAGNFSPHHRVQKGSGVYPASYPMDSRGFYLGVKRPGREADHSPPSSSEVKECVELYLHFPNTAPRRGAQLKAQGQLYFLLTLLYPYFTFSVRNTY
jgi:hypothetical protein